MLGGKEAERNRALSKGLEPIQLHYPGAREVPTEPVPVLERGKIERYCAQASQAGLIQMIIVVVGNEDYLRKGEIFGGEGERETAPVPGPHVAKDRIGEYILPRQPDPKAGMSEIGHGISSSLDFLDPRWDHRKSQGSAFSPGVGVGAEEPL